MRGRDILDAAALGYEVTGALARLFAAAGITRWHRTSLAGQGGAAAAAMSVPGRSVVARRGHCSGADDERRHRPDDGGAGVGERIPSCVRGAQR